MVAHDYSPNTRETEAGELPQDPGCPKFRGVWCEALSQRREKNLHGCSARLVEQRSTAHEVAGNCQVSQGL